MQKQINVSVFLGNHKGFPCEYYYLINNGWGSIRCFEDWSSWLVYPYEIRICLQNYSIRGLLQATLRALAMTEEERYCESAVADAAVSSYIAHERNKFLSRRVATTQSQ